MLKRSQKSQVIQARANLLVQLSPAVPATSVCAPNFIIIDISGSHFWFHLLIKGFRKSSLNVSQSDFVVAILMSSNQCFFLKKSLFSFSYILKF